MGAFILFITLKSIKTSTKFPAKPGLISLILDRLNV